jgi:D-glycero-D-manno-heptose 1,7-bisphosphate phosphatase
MQLVIVDREGVIDIDVDGASTSERGWQVITGSLEALARLSGAGYRLVVVSSQAQLRRKDASIENLNTIHHNMQNELLEAGGGLDAVFFCGCPPKKECDCLMPNPTMLLEIGTRLRISLEGVPVIGTSMTTVEAARAAGARAVLVCNPDRIDERASDISDDLECYDDLAAAVDGLLAEIAPS